MTFVPALASLINSAMKTRNYGRKWINNWLIPNAKNRVSVVPMDSSLSLVTSLRILFEYPFQAICDVVSESSDCSLVPIVAIRDTQPTDIYIVDSSNKQVVAVFQMKAWKFRFGDLRELEKWMRKTYHTVKSKLKEAAHVRRAGKSRSPARR